MVDRIGPAARPSLGQALAAIPVSGWVLVVANLVPLLGVLGFDWNVFNVLILFWAENLVIGLVQILRMLAAGNRHGQKIALVPFFAVHYGMFTVGHGAILIELFGDSAGIVPSAGGLSSVFATADSLFSADRQLMLAFIALLVSHLFSFGTNFVGKGLYRDATPNDLFAQPYGRVIVMHVTVLVGGFAAQSLGSPLWALLVLIGLKTVFDLNGHIKQNDYQQT